MSLQLRNIEEVLGPDAAIPVLARALERMAGIPLDSATLFVTPANEQALPRHSDNYEVFVLQLRGSKRWQAGERDIVMMPGDMIYIPMGLPHQAVACGTEASISVSFLLTPFRRSDLLTHCLEILKDHPAMQTALPPLDPMAPQFDLAAEMGRSLAALIADPTFTQWLELGLKRLSLRAQPPPPLDLVDLGAVTTNCMLERTPGVAAVYRVIGEQLLLEVAGGLMLEAPHFVEPEIEAVFATSFPFCAADIARNLPEADVLKLLVKLKVLGVIRRKNNETRMEARSEAN